MSKEATTRLTPWLLLCAFCLTLSTLVLRDVLDTRPRRAPEPLPAPVSVVVLAN